MTELDPSILEALRRYDTPTMSNAIETFGVKPWDQGFASWEIRSMFPDFEPMVGYAATVTIRARGEGGPGNQEVMYEHVQTIPSPRVVVVQDLDDPPGCGALWGEVQSTVLKGLGALGTVTNGCVRDLKEVRQIGFQFFAAGVGVSHAYVRVIDTGIEVKIGGPDRATGRPDPRRPARGAVDPDRDRGPTAGGCRPDHRARARH